MTNLTFLVVLAYLLMSPAYAQNALREYLHQDKLSEAGIKQAISVNESPQDATTRAYKGLFESMLAEYAFLPTTKWKWFSKGTSNIDEAVASSSDNAEIRYIRLLVSLNVPSFLGYGQNIEEDLRTFEKEIGGIDKKWSHKFIASLLESKYIEEGEKQKLKELHDRTLSFSLIN